MVFGKVQKKLQHCGKASELPALGLEKPTSKSKAALVLQRGGLCGSNLKIDPFNLYGGFCPKIVLQSGTQISNPLFLTRSMQAMAEGQLRTLEKVFLLCPSTGCVPTSFGKGLIWQCWKRLWQLWKRRTHRQLWKRLQLSQLLQTAVVKSCAHDWV